MNRVRRLAVVAGLLVGLAVCAMGQEKPGVVTAASSKLAPIPVLPPCATLSAQRGDPSKGPAVILIKMTSGCKVVWHWHSVNESLMMVGGKGTIEMKDEKIASAMTTGDYLFLPAKHIHQFTCNVACTFFDVTDGAFDLHYVDKDGKEIPVDQVIKPAGKPASPKKK